MARVENNFRAGILAQEGWWGKQHASITLESNMCPRIFVALSMGGESPQHFAWHINRWFRLLSKKLDSCEDDGPISLGYAWFA